MAYLALTHRVGVIFMSWITLTEAAKLTNKPVRTLRHQAANGKIVVKKDGRNWLVKKSCLTSEGEDNGTATSEISNPPNSIPFRQGNVPQKQNGNRKFKTLDDLGVYNELKGIVLSLDSSARKDQAPIYFLLKKGLKLIAMGFYEYNKIKKGECFAKARSVVAQALVEAQLEANDFCKALGLALQNSILPGLSGLIRKMDTREKNHG